MIGRSIFETKLRPNQFKRRLRLTELATNSPLIDKGFHLRDPPALSETKRCTSRSKPKPSPKLSRAKRITFSFLHETSLSRYFSEIRDIAARIPSVFMIVTGRTAAASL